MVGFKYLRNEGVGISSNIGGIRSSLNGTRGSKDGTDFWRSSSSVIIGVLMLEMLFAADRKAFKDSVRFDLRTDRRGGIGQ